MNGCLEGIRVLELGNFIPALMARCCSRTWAQKSSRLKIRKGGDPFRGWDLGGDQPNFWAYNRGKKSVTLNLQTPGGQRDLSWPGQRCRCR